MKLGIPLNFKIGTSDVELETCKLRAFKRGRGNTLVKTECIIKVRKIRFFFSLMRKGRLIE